MQVNQNVQAVAPICNVLKQPLYVAVDRMIAGNALNRRRQVGRSDGSRRCEHIEAPDLSVRSQAPLRTPRDAPGTSAKVMANYGRRTRQLQPEEPEPEVLVAGTVTVSRLEATSLRHPDRVLLGKRNPEPRVVRAGFE